MSKVKALSEKLVEMFGVEETGAGFISADDSSALLPKNLNREQFKTAISHISDLQQASELALASSTVASGHRSTSLTIELDSGANIEAMVDRDGPSVNSAFGIVYPDAEANRKHIMDNILAEIEEEATEE